MGELIVVGGGAAGMMAAITAAGKGIPEKRGWTKPFAIPVLFTLFLLFSIFYHIRPLFSKQKAVISGDFLPIL